MHRRDVRMLDRSGGPSFLDESLLAVFVLSKVRGEKLERDLSLQLGVFGKVDLAHTTLADFLETSIMRDRRTDHGSSGPPGRSAGEEYAFLGSRSTRDRLAAEARFSVPAVDEGLSFQLLGVPHHDWAP